MLCASSADAVRIQSSVLPRVWRSVVGITIYAAVITAADLWYGMNWKASGSIVAPLSVTVGLLIVFRNSTSYDRWYEGRKMFQSATSDVQNLARFLWINVDPESGKKYKELVETAKGPTATDEEKIAAAEWVGTCLGNKRRIVRLLAAYLFATKHHLRQEYGVDWQDYDGLLPQDVKEAYYGLERKSRESFRRSLYASHERFSGASTDLTPTTAEFLRTQTVDEHTPLTSSEEHEEEEHARQPAVPIPIFVLHHVSTYVARARRAGLLDDAGPAGFSLANQLTNSLTTHFFQMQRIADTSIPVIYGIHLKQCVLLYLLALPLTLVSELGWRVIPVVTVVAFTMIGLEGISSEVENPWGDDASDHNLDFFAAAARHELEHMMLLQIETED